jgi:hypothetical protein
MLVVCALVSTLSALGAAVYVEALKTARVTRAIGDLHALDIDVRAFHLRNNRYPTTLTEARPIVPNDPWGRPYVYTDLSGEGRQGQGAQGRQAESDQLGLRSLQHRRGRPDDYAAEATAEQGRRHPRARRRVPRPRGRVLGPMAALAVDGRPEPRRPARRGALRLSAWYPLLIFAGVTSWTVSAYLLRQEQGRLRGDGQGIVDGALERLLDVEDRLRAIAAQPADTIAPASLRASPRCRGSIARGRPRPFRHVDPAGLR